MLLLQRTVRTGNKPGHELVQLLLVLLVLGSDGMLGLLLHPLHKVLHVLEGVDLAGNKQTSPTGYKLLISSPHQSDCFGGFVYQRCRDVSSNLIFLSQR